MTDVGMDTAFRDEQVKKALYWTAVTEVGILIVTKPLFAKTFDPRRANEVGNETEVRELQY